MLQYNMPALHWAEDYEQYLKISLKYTQVLSSFIMWCNFIHGVFLWSAGITQTVLFTGHHSTTVLPAMD